MAAASHPTGAGYAAREPCLRARRGAVAPAALALSVLVLLVLAALALAGAPVAVAARTPSEPPEARPAQSAECPGARIPRAVARSSGGPAVEVLATGLAVPWEIAFMPDGCALITERGGAVRLRTSGGALRPIARIGVLAAGEGGLLGAAVDPDFTRNRLVYLYRTTRSGNEVLRYRFTGSRLISPATIVRGVRAAAVHDGGRIHFGPDRNLYIATGDAAQPDLAQDRRSLNGKILRMRPPQYRGSGGRPEVFSLGHRNPQGFDWQPGSRRLFASEHGPDGDDEINLIELGRNYGWPRVRGGRRGRGFTPPLAVYPTSIAPSGGAFVSRPGSRWSGDFLVAALVGRQVRRLAFGRRGAFRNEPLFGGAFGRLRTVVEGPDGALYALTSNTDGRGSPSPGDDRLLRIVPPR